MLSTRNADLLSSVAGLLVAACVSVAQADDHKGGGRIETDIDKLSGQLHADGNEWNLAIEYEVEFEGGLPAGEPVMVLTVTESGRLLADDEGQPIELVVPLDQPRDVDDDEFEFEQELTLFLPAESIREPSRVALHGAVGHLEPAFEPQLWFDISDHLDAKLTAMQAYKSQIRPAPDARSIEAVRALATWRGSIVGMHAAEAFVLVRECLAR